MFLKMTLGSTLTWIRLGLSESSPFYLLISRIMINFDRLINSSSMKHFLLTLTIVIGCSLLASCEKETILTVNQSSLSFNNSGGSQTINLVANKVWTASSNQSWCKVSPSSGDGSDNSNITLSVSCDANASYDERTCTITITCEELIKTTSVSQAEGKGLIVSQTEYNLTNDAQTISVEVQANVNYSVEIDNACKSWIKQDATKGLSSNVIKFAISKNDDYDGREGKIVIKQTDGSLSGTVVVKQSQQNGLFISTPEYSLSNEKHTLTVEVRANVEFEVKPNVDWIKHVETKGLKTSQIVLDIAANEEYDGREGTVVVKQKNGDLEGVITIKQEQNYGILVSQSEYSVSNEAQTIDVEVKYNVDFDVVIPDSCKDWISVVGTKGLSSRDYTIAIAKNESYDNREGSITFKQKNGSLSGTVSVYQSQTDGIIAEKKEYVVSAEKQQLSIKVAANVGYQIIIDEGCRDWLSQIQTKGLSEETILFQVAKNEGEERIGKITLMNEHIQDVVLVRQEAEGIVEFEDAIFKSYCVNNFDKNGDGEISYSEARQISVITIVDIKRITSLHGIEHMPNLLVLQCENAKLKSLDVSKNPNLEQLNCRINELTSLDLSNNPNLYYLDCQVNQLTSLSVNNNTALTELFCGSNQLTSLDVSRCTALNYLSCGNNQLKSLDVSKNHSLIRLSCDGNQLAKLVVDHNANLISLNCAVNQLTSIDLSNNTSLKELYCGYNNLKNLDISGNTSLKSLVCDYNQLKSLNISDNVSLESLYCDYNQLTSLDLNNNTSLKEVYCENNQITNLTISNASALATLRCTGNLLSSLDVSNQTSLKELLCGDNPLSTLKLDNTTSLTSLRCYNNQLTHLNVSTSTSLQLLMCMENQLSRIDVSNNLSLRVLYCFSNPTLTEIWLKKGQLETISDFLYDEDIATIKYK